MLSRAHGKGADDAGQGGKSSGHDNSAITEEECTRMGRLSAKSRVFATPRCGMRDSRTASSRDGEMQYLTVDACVERNRYHFSARQR